MIEGEKDVEENLGWHSWEEAAVFASDGDEWHNLLPRLKSPHGLDEDE